MYIRITCWSNVYHLTPTFIYSKTGVYGGIQFLAHLLGSHGELIGWPCSAVVFCPSVHNFKDLLL